MNSFLNHLGLLSDVTRCRLLRAAETDELTVGELCAVLELPQSTVSRHLKQLGDLGWVQLRKEGSRRFYRVDLEPLAARERRLWMLLRNELNEDDADFRGDARRLQRVINKRRAASQSFFSSAASEWDRLRTDLFGERFDLLGLLGLLDPSWVIGDLGCGTGTIAATLAPFVSKVIAVDSSTEMLEVAGAALKNEANVDLRAGVLEHLPIEDATLDAGILFLVLQYTASPKAVLFEARRVLKPGAPLLVVDLMSHQDEELRVRMGHQRLGFSQESLAAEFARAGFDPMRWVEVPTQPRTKTGGVTPPRLFSTSARAPETVAARRPRPTAVSPPA